MSSGYTEFLDFTGPVAKDTTFTRDGIKWSQYQPAGVIGKSLVTFTIPAFRFNSNIPGPGTGFLFPYIIGQFNCVAPQPFTLLDWNNPATQSIFYNDTFGTLAISYRVGNTKFRYALYAGNGFDQGSAIVAYGIAPLYKGQIIEPNFTIEAWTPFGIRVPSYLTTPVTLGTSILNQPARFTPNTTILSNIPPGAVIQPTLYTALPSNLPMNFGNDGPWNNNP